MTSFDDSLLFSEKPFATGAAQYWDVHPGLKEAHSRIYVQFRPDGVGPDLSFLALVDTGAHYCILNERVASLVKNQLTDGLGEVDLRTAYGTVRGTLYTHRIVLIAEAGESLSAPVTLFIAPDWQGPCFLGYTGALERLRFAIDPETNRFYFASVC